MPVTRLPQSRRCLRTLALNSRQRQWTADQDINWNQDIVRPNWLLRRFHGAMISQFRHGELITIKICRHLLDVVTEPGVKELLIQQIADEERHAEVYRRYLEKLGDAAPLDPSLAHAVERIIQWQGSYLGLIVAVHVLLEGEALRTLQDLSDEMPCPLFSQMNKLIVRDEARHVAFGKVYLRQRLANLGLDERMAIYRFVKLLWCESTGGMFLEFRITGIVTQSLRRRWVNEGWLQHRRSLTDIGLLNAQDMARA